MRFGRNASSGEIRCYRPESLIVPPDGRRKGCTLHTSPMPLGSTSRASSPYPVKAVELALGHCSISPAFLNSLPQYRVTAFHPRASHSFDTPFVGNDPFVTRLTLSLHGGVLGTLPSCDSIKISISQAADTSLSHHDIRYISLCPTFKFPQPRS